MPVWKIFFYKSVVHCKKQKLKKMKRSFADTQNIILKNEFLTFHSLYRQRFSEQI